MPDSWNPAPGLAFAPIVIYTITTNKGIWNEPDLTREIAI
ncbi:hypothetical protein CFU_3132 [Collimonas fungivorans Ter331]|uniref:Uncharacterized protein n=1 Tax=Collimonas fungivorans (strain Ter331) TaxID=1005048 RepID=G0ACT3_COLFT|nr:hypothetical protein CFU_3132 [Collimonas fungivorans Ter331]